MKLTFALLGVLCCLVSAKETLENTYQKRSILFGDELLGLPLTDTSISSHTHTHTTAIVDRPVPVAVPIATTKIISPVLTATKVISRPSISSSIFSSYPSTYNYGALSSFPYGSGFENFYGSYGKYYPSTFKKYYPNFEKFYSSSYLPSLYTSKSFYSPSIYKW